MIQQIVYFWIAPIIMGVFIPIIWARARNMQPHRIANIWEMRGDPPEYVLVKKKWLGLGEAEFNVGERQFIVEADTSNMYNAGAQILDYVLTKARPRTVKLGLVDRIRGKSNKQYDPIKPTKAQITKITDGKDPSSASTNLYFRREGLKQMIQATRGVDFKAFIPIGIVVLLAGIAAGFGLFSYMHPGFVQAPPAGYTYHVVPIPTNATVVSP